MSNLTPAERSARARIGAHSKWAACADTTAATAPARDAFWKRFLDEVDPDRVLPELERERRARHAKAAYFTRLSFQSARARSRQGKSTTTT